MASIALFLFYDILNTELLQLGKPADVLLSTCYSFSTKDKLKHAGNNSTNKNEYNLILHAGCVLNIAVKCKLLVSNLKL
jgi:hypothetical protein